MKAKEENVKIAKCISGSPKLKTYVDELMSSDNNLTCALESTEIKEIVDEIKSSNVLDSNDLFYKYKQKETDLNILIMSINQRLKSISSKDGCLK